jgi:hypothetical protein
MAYLRYSREESEENHCPLANNELLEGEALHVTSCGVRLREQVMLTTVGYENELNNSGTS